ncbi:hypothetical protein [Actinoplanes subtropicus]|uniref:hypothetical protein n=1 Tax=Actinoplanes subtropicus TaxID=543632 RepID=UPI0012F8B79D|nr:hypothetical protein [Actinoplanes subtropicus]
MSISHGDVQGLRRSLTYHAALWVARLGYVWMFAYPVVAWVWGYTWRLFMLYVAGAALVLSLLVLLRRARVPVARPAKWNVPARERYRQFWRDTLWWSRGR